MDLPLITGQEIEHQPRLAAFSSPWTPININRQLDTQFTLSTQVTTQTVVGITTGDFYSGPTGRWDDGNELYIEIFNNNASLTSSTEIAVLDGLNGIAIENADGEWEILQFVTTTLQGVRKYKLTKLLRGQLGTEYAMRDPIAEGSRVVIINVNTMPQLPLTLNQRTLSYLYKYGPSNRDISHFTYQEETRTFQGNGLRPYSPTDVKISNDGSNNLTFSWLRRTRKSGDIWDNGDVPLIEDNELYEIDILNSAGDTVLRTLFSSTNSVVYSSTDFNDDFSPLPSSINIVVYQLGSIYGRGTGKSVTLEV